jgi:hypothetical protein
MVALYYNPIDRDDLQNLLIIHDLFDQGDDA